MSQNTQIIIFVSIVVVFLVVSAIKQRNSTWKGRVVKKKERKVSSDYGASSKLYTLIFETEDGKKKRANVKKELYESTGVGNRFEKIKGKFSPNPTKS